MFSCPVGPAWWGQESGGELVTPAGASSAAPLPSCRSCCLAAPPGQGQGQRQPVVQLLPPGTSFLQAPPSSGLVWAGPPDSSRRGQRGTHRPGPGWGEECTGPGRGIIGPSEEGGRGGCTKQACVSPEWAALSWALTGRAGPWGVRPGRQGPGANCLGRQEVWPRSLGLRPNAGLAARPPGRKVRVSLPWVQAW